MARIFAERARNRGPKPRCRSEAEGLHAVVGGGPRARKRTKQFGVTHSTRISTPPFRPPRLEPERKGRFQVFFGGKSCYQFYLVMKMENLITTPQAKWSLNGTSAPRCHPCPGYTNIKLHD